jgi:hypothetical protein
LRIIRGCGWVVDLEELGGVVVPGGGLHGDKVYPVISAWRRNLRFSYVV